MAYNYLIPRTNYFPPGPPYLAGLGALAADQYGAAYARYQADLANWQREKAAYDKAEQVYLGAVQMAQNNYGAAQARYAAEKAAWDREAAAHSIAMGGWQRAYEQQVAKNAEVSRQVASTFGLKLPPEYFAGGACISPASFEYAKARCTTVKGLGSPLDYGDWCGIRRLPICSFPNKPTLRAQPVPPTTPALPPRPAQLRPPPAPPPAPPAVTAPPPMIPAPPPTTMPPPGPTLSPPPEGAPLNKQSNLVMGGLLAVVVVGGGFLIYRTVKGPKKAAA